MSLKNIELFRSYSRHSPIPMDVTSLYKTYKEAAKYVADSKAAYAGQVVSVVSEVTGAVTVYKIAYDTDNSLTLVEIGSGTGSGSGFDIKGSYETYAELVAAQPTPDDGDIYLVCKAGTDASGNYYGAFYMADNGDFISISPQHFVYATEVHGGIISHETFTSLVNKEGSPAVYFNSGEGSSVDPGTNGWVTIATQGTESSYGSEKMTIPTTNRVLKLIANGGSDIPSLKLVNTSSALSETNSVDAIGSASFSILFHQGLAGVIKKIAIELNDSIVKDNWFPDAGDISYVKANGEVTDVMVKYAYDGEGIDRSDGAVNSFKATLYYEPSDSMPAGTVDSAISYEFHTSALFGTDYLEIKRDNEYVHTRRSGVERTLSGEMSYSFKVDPDSPFDKSGETDNNGVSGLWVRITNTYRVKSVYWSQQPNIDFSPIFEKKAGTGEGDAAMNYYEFTTNEEFTAPSVFDITIEKIV